MPYSFVPNQLAKKPHKLQSFWFWKKVVFSKLVNLCTECLAKDYYIVVVWLRQISSQVCYIILKHCVCEIRVIQGLGTTNQKGQMPPRRLFTLTRGIQIRGQSIKIFFENFLKIF